MRMRAHRGGVGRVLGDVEAHLDVALRAEVVDLVGLEVADQVDQGAGVRQVAVVHQEPNAGLVRVVVDRLQPLGVERGRPPDEAVNVVSLGQEELGEIGAVLPVDASDECLLHQMNVNGSTHRHVAGDGERAGWIRRRCSRRPIARRWRRATPVRPSA